MYSAKPSAEYFKRLDRYMYMLDICGRAAQCGVNTDFEYRFNPNHDDKGRFCAGNGKGLTKSAGSVRLDSKGKPYKYPTVQLPKKEYANVMEQINRYWTDLFSEKEMCHMTFTKKTYYFENHGLGDYNIYRVKRSSK